MSYPTSRAAAPAILADLLDNANPDGGWGSRASHPSDTESTCLALLGLWRYPDPTAREAATRGLAWLETRQREDGAWPHSDVVPETTWATSLGTLVLGRYGGRRRATVAAAEWLLRERGRSLPWLLRAKYRVFPDSKPTDLDSTLLGWPWTEETFSWVEPTSWALLALKAFGHLLPGSATRDRITEGEAMLRDRMCVGGGWNYGNSRVLGEELWPYPDTTALALIALQDAEADAGSEASLRALDRMLSTHESGLALALATLAFQVHGRDADAVRARLIRRHRETGFRGRIRSLALASVATVTSPSPLRLSASGSSRGGR